MKKFLIALLALSLGCTATIGTRSLTGPIPESRASTRPCVGNECREDGISITASQFREWAYPKLRELAAQYTPGDVPRLLIYDEPKPTIHAGRYWRWSKTIEMWTQDAEGPYLSQGMLHYVLIHEFLHHEENVKEDFTPNFNHTAVFDARMRERKLWPEVTVDSRPMGPVVRYSHATRRLLAAGNPPSSGHLEWFPIN